MKIFQSDALRKDVDWVGLIAILIMLVGASIISYHYITREIHSCTSDPLKYAVEQIMWDDNSTYEYIILEIYLKKDDLIAYKSRVLDLAPESFPTLY